MHLKKMAVIVTVVMLLGVLPACSSEIKSNHGSAAPDNEGTYTSLPGSVPVGQTNESTLTSLPGSVPDGYPKVTQAPPAPTEIIEQANNISSRFPPEQFINPAEGCNCTQTTAQALQNQISLPEGFTGTSAISCDGRVCRIMVNGTVPATVNSTALKVFLALADNNSADFPKETPPPAKSIRF